MKYNAAVIGLGQIGQGYDYDYHDESLVLTHSSGYKFHNSFNLVAGVDNNKDYCSMFEKKYNVQTFNCVNEMMEKCNPDVISISTSTNTHFDIYKKVAYYSPKAILLEKPISENINQANHIISNAKKNGIVLFVNYLRRFEPGTNNLKKMISNGLIGEIYKGNVWYCKGLKNNGSHFIDLLMYLFGDVENVKMISSGRSFDSLGYKDVEPDFLLEFNNTNIIFQSSRSECFSLGEFVLIGTKGSLYYGNGKIEYKLTKPDSIVKDYTILQTEPINIKTDFNRSQFFVMDSIVNYFEKKRDIYSDGDSALKTLKIIEKIISLR
ncbi:MAG: Gfo/Idh/MocA family oxidoreductase [Deltaproteobacteria bacterium]|nr:Gfo/Idh/MocA family oxidoreductase [Deltaproteobacteria bacterium]